LEYSIFVYNSLEETVFSIEIEPLKLVFLGLNVSFIDQLDHLQFRENDVILGFQNGFYSPNHIPTEQSAKLQRVSKTRASITYPLLCEFTNLQNDIQLITAEIQDLLAESKEKLRAEVELEQHVS
jgi:hypothetical protein